MKTPQKKRYKHKPYLKFKAILAEKGLNQKYIAKLLELSPVTVNQKINGTLEFTFSEVEKICVDLSVNTDIFLTQKVS